MNRLPEAIGELLQKENYTYGDLVEIVRYLRSENGCPWDRAQTHETLSVNLVEECYELVDAIALKSADKMRGTSSCRRCFTPCWARRRGNLPTARC